MLHNTWCPFAAAVMHLHAVLRQIIIVNPAFEHAHLPQVIASEAVA